MNTRIEKDSLGRIEVPKDAYYGAFTERAKNNFRISGILADHVLISSYATIKKAAALANMKLGLLDERVGKAIVEAADDVISGSFRDQFVLDVFQAGAGTPFNMNTNEVIANAAIERLGGKKGDYSIVHPNNHVNMAQSSNDVTPTAIRIACLMKLGKLLAGIDALAESFRKKGEDYDDVIKVGRTHLEDAVPIRYGQVFRNFALCMENAGVKIDRAKQSLLELGIGGTAVGTGINTHPEFRKLMVEELSRIAGFEFRPCDDPIRLTWSMTGLLELSGSLRMLAIDLNKISNDLRFLNSGPKAGIAEIILPEVEPGSSIMPGKINPSIPEAMNMICYQVAGNDHAIALAADAGQLELNVMTPLIAFDLLWNIDLLANGIAMLREKCVDGIIVDRDRCRNLLDGTMCLATVLNPYLGYEVVAGFVKKALAENRSFEDVLRESNIVPEKYLKDILDAKKMTMPREINKQAVAEIRERLRKLYKKVEINDKTNDDYLIVSPEPDACETRTPHDHVQMFRTIENPLRREIIKKIGFSGIKKADLQKRMRIDNEKLKFQLDFLIHECYIEVKDDVCRLTEKGIGLLSNIK